jgi:hypothetical protein|tara:strand:+ start:5461 stop:5757 length:297 start_codon:yes stop_codon:yes gene_type:complete
MLRSRIVNEEIIHTAGGPVRITIHYLGICVYEVRIISEDGILIEEFDEMGQRTAGNTFNEKCRFYREGGQNHTSVFLDLEEGLPDREVTTNLPYDDRI